MKTRLIFPNADVFEKLPCYGDGSLLNFCGSVCRYMFNAYGGGNMALIFLQYALYVFPLQATDRRSLRAERLFSTGFMAECP